MIKIKWILITLFFASAKIGSAQVLDQVMAQVGGETILISEVSEILRISQDQNKVLSEEQKCAVLENVIFQKLLTNKAKLDSILLSDDQVENQLNARMDRVLAYMNNDVSQFESYYGKSVSEMKDELREDLRNQMLAENMKTKIVENINITPEEIKKYYASIHKDSLPYYSSEVEYSEVNIYPKINLIERQKVLDKLNSIRARIVENGESFEDNAKKFSQDGSAQTGGDLGWSKRGAFVPEFEAAVFNLDEGQVSTIVESEFGFHIIKLLERRGNTFHALHILLKPEITQGDIDLTHKLIDSVKNEIVSGKLDFIEAVKKFGNKNFPSFTNGGRAINEITNTNFFQISDLEPDIYFTIEAMKVEGISNPQELTDLYGNKYFKLIQLSSRSDPHKASLEKDFSKIKDIALSIKKENELNSWFTENIGATYIFILPEWLNKCENLNQFSHNYTKN